MKCVITTLCEKSDHDGYCSDEYCVYSNEIYKHVLDNDEIPEQYKEHPIGNLENPAKYNWLKHLPEKRVNFGSHFCGQDKESQYAGLYRHTYRYTIITVSFYKDTDDIF